jgi:DNA replication protein DnaC
MAKLASLRDQGLREQAQREAAQRVADSAATAAIARAVKATGTRPTRSATPAPAFAGAVKTLWDAARLPPFDDWGTFASIAGRCESDLARQLGARYSPESVRLKNFHVYDSSGRQGAALAQMQRFLADMEAVIRETRGLVLYGSVGTGKDHFLAAALYYVASAGITAGWASGQDIYLRIRDSMDSRELERKILRPFIDPFVLGISDPVSPGGALGNFDARVLAGLLDKRYRAMRPTWLTMNADNEVDAKAKLTPLIWDRFRHGAEIIPCFWPSFRGLRAKPGEAVAGKVGAPS